MAMNEKASPLVFLQTNPVVSSLSDAFKAFSERRAKLGLSNPGSVENVGKEVQRDVFLNNYMFTGLKADLTKAFSLNPLFQVSHQFAICERLNPYTIAAMDGTRKVCLTSPPPSLLRRFPKSLPRMYSYALSPRFSCKATWITMETCPRGSTTDGVLRQSPRHNSRYHPAARRIWPSLSTNIRAMISRHP